MLFWRVCTFDLYLLTKNQQNPLGARSRLLSLSCTDSYVQHCRCAHDHTSQLLYQVHVTLQTVFVRGYTQFDTLLPGPLFTLDETYTALFAVSRVSFSCTSIFLKKVILASSISWHLLNSIVMSSTYLYNKTNDNHDWTLVKFTQYLALAAPHPPPPQTARQHFYYTRLFKAFTIK